jgi:hypothetical protein
MVNQKFINLCNATGLNNKGLSDLLNSSVPFVTDLKKGKGKVSKDVTDRINLFIKYKREG